MKISGIELNWLGHSGFIVNNGSNIHIDPYMISDKVEKADIILITHGHYDHCSIADMIKIVKDGTIIIIPAGCQSKITKFSHKVDMRIMQLGEELVLDEIKISTFPAYNLNNSFHPKDEGWFGYIIRLNGVIG